VLLQLASPDAQAQLEQARQADAEAAAAGRVRVRGVNLSRQQRAADRAAEHGFAAAEHAAREIADPALRASALASMASARQQYAAARAQAQDLVAQANSGLASLGSAVAAVSGAQRIQTRAALAIARRTVTSLTVKAPITGIVTYGGQAPVASGGLTDLAGLAGALGTGSSAAGALAAAGAAGQGGTASGEVGIGTPVSAGDLLATVTDTSTLSLRAEVDETDILLVRPRVVAEVEFDAVPDAGYPATVLNVDPNPATSSRGGVSYTVRLTLGAGRTVDGEPAPRPLPGMSAVARLQVRTAVDVVSVPAAAVFRDGPRDAVWVVEGGVAHRRAVRLGAQGEDQVQVLAGVAPGARIVVRGADVVRDGQRLP
jgi:hypothetical protein